MEMHMPTWTIECDVPMLDLEPPPTRRVPFPQHWFTEQPEMDSGFGFGSELDEAPTRIDGKVRVFGDPIELNRRGPHGSKRATIPAPKHADGPGPSIHSVVTRYIGE